MRPLPPTFVDLLRAKAEQVPDLRVLTYLVDGEEQEEHATYRELDRSARAIAAELQRRGLSGERVLLLYPPGLDFIRALLGCFYANVVAVPAYPPDPSRLARTLPRLRTVLASSQSKAILCTSFIVQMAESLFELAPDLRESSWVATDALEAGLEDAWRAPALTPESLAFFQYTSGSTSEPKGVMLSHANLVHNSELIRRSFAHDAQSVGVIWLPPYHDMGLIGGILQPLYVGFHTVLMSPLDFLQQPLRWLKAVTKYRGRTSGGPNFAYELCVRRAKPEDVEQLDLSSWTLAFTGAEPVRAQTLRRFVETFSPAGFRETSFYPCYGLAEATLIVTGKADVSGRPLVKRVDKTALEVESRAVEVTDATAPELVGCGPAVADTDVRVVDPDTCREVAPGRVGEVWVRGRSVSSGYWGREDETARVFQGYLADGGEGPFLRTEDLGLMMDGELFVTGRRKDLIILRGRNIHPQDIERVAEESHPALRQGGCAAFAMDEDGEERLVVVQEVDVRKQPDLEQVAKDLRRAVLQQQDVPVHTLVLLKPGHIPKTSSGKLQRARCRAAFQQGELETLLVSPLAPGKRSHT
ncbi:fatty acyl-AMP ligase [Pyxidicoccus xibeiensis]|uniref:fatty acyl-AMP ligase n=1 Tax=Pyxidicoccus xibeiensis TaxID=2906759 RepID=UPI0020A78AD2|nr:fatty acyl-AMP ligase [Pyxidicoccus xibeiensis]MCP3138576.1 fatty acyl-AMP ligase [Pyxidicoccus xibeiensis]